MSEIKHEGLLEAISLLEAGGQDKLSHAISKIRLEQKYIEALQRKLCEAIKVLEKIDNHIVKPINASSTLVNIDPQGIKQLVNNTLNTLKE